MDASRIDVSQDRNQQICPYSFVPIAHSLTPKLSARTSAVLLKRRSELVVPNFGIRAARVVTTFKHLLVIYRPGVHFEAILTAPSGTSALASLSEASAFQRGAARAQIGLVVGSLTADPRFATRSMWETGNTNDDDHRTIYLRMAWLAEFGEAKLEQIAPEFAQIEIADFRSRNALLDVWEALDREISPTLGSGDSRRSVIRQSDVKSGIPDPLLTVSLSKASEQLATHRSFPWLLPFGLTVGLGAVVAGYNMYTGTSASREVQGAGSGFAESGGSAQEGSGSARNAVVPAAAASGGAGSGSGSGVGSGSGSGAAQPDAVAGTPAVVQPEASQITKGAATLEEVCETLKVKGSTSKRFNKDECPQGALTPGCSIEETRDSCIVTITP